MTLRKRLLISLLAVSALGMVAVATVTYADQHNSLYKRLEAQLRSAPAEVGQTINYQGELHGSQGIPTGVNTPTPDVGLPQGSCGQLRTRNGKVLLNVDYFYGQENDKQPVLPAKIALNKEESIKGYFVLAEPIAAQAQGEELEVVAAIPLATTNQTLHQLLLIELIVIFVSLTAIAGLSLLVVKVGLQPLRRFSRSAERIVAGDTEERLEETGKGDEISDLGTSFNHMIDHLQHALKGQEESADRLRQFVADASHELRTPLTSIRGYAELYRLGGIKDEKEMGAAMQRIDSESQRMAALVEQLLTLAKMEQLPQLQREELDLAGIVDPIVTDTRLIKERDIALIGDGSVWGDSGSLQQIASNLINNACIHGKGKVQVEITSADGKTQMTVHDEGPGLPDPPEKVFERFWRASASRERPGGNGLGLSIVKALVEAQDGEIKAENVNGGALFTVILPSSKPI